MPFYTNLIPHFIKERYRAGEFEGSFEAATIFVDLSGFTRLAAEFARAEKEGAERLADTLHAVFNPLLREVYSRGGFVTSFAGDAFTAVYPVDKASRSSISVITMAYETAVIASSMVETIAASRGIRLGVRTGLAFGEVVWGIVGDTSPYLFYFRGSSVEDAAEAECHAQIGQIIAPLELRSRGLDHIATRKIRGLPFIRTAIHPVNPSFTLMKVPPLTSNDLLTFIPEEILNMDHGAEFRDIAPVFISFEQMTDHDEIQDIAIDIMSISRRLGGFFSQIEFGDKGCIFVILFGAPIAFESNADRAVEFLLACREFDWPARWRGGSAYGTAWAGIRGSAERCEYGAIGDVMNIAARLATRASWGEVLIADSLRNSLKRDYRFVKSKFTTIRGRRDQTAVHTLGDTRGTEVGSAYSGNMIGRVGELRQLEKFVLPIYSGRFAGIIHIHGDAGTGKSRLVFELRRSLNNLHTARIGWITCPADEIHRLPLHPIRQGFRRFFDQFGERSINARKRRFSSIMKDVISETVNSDHIHASEIGEELKRLQSVLGALVDLYWEGSFYDTLDPKLRFENTVKAVRLLLKARSLVRPIVFFIEDAHWLDEESKRLLRRIPFGLNGFPVACIYTSRYSDDGHRISLIGKNEFRHLTLDLNNLSIPQIDALADQFLGTGISSRLRDSIVTRTGGNPFFIEQLLLHLQAEKSLIQSGDTLDIQGSDVTVPLRIGEILVARLDRLPKQVREMVQRSAILGNEFDIEILARMQPVSTNISRVSRKAVEERLWIALDDTRYTFRHALMRDAAYTMQTKTRRRMLHQGAVEAIEQVSGGEYEGIYDDLYYHSHEAGDRDREKHYAFMAGKEAYSKYANEAAGRYFQRALELTPYDQLKRRFEILFEWIVVLETQGRRDEQDHVLERMTKIADDLDDDVLRAKVFYRKSILSLRRSDYPSAISFARDTIRIGEARNLLEVQVSGYDYWARALMFQGDYEKARSLLYKGLDITGKADIPDMDARLRNVLGIVAKYEGDRSTALKHYMDVLRIAKTQDNKRLELTVLTNIGNLHAEHGEFFKAQSYHKDTVRISREMGAMTTLSGSLTNLGNVLDSLGNRAGALDCYHEALELCREIENHFGEGNALGNIGMIASAEGRYEASMRLHEKAMKIFQRIGYRWGEAWSWECLAGIAVSIGLWDEVDDRCERAMIIYRELRDERGEVMTLKWRILSDIHLGNLDRSVSSGDWALKTARSMEDEPILGAILIRIGMIAKACGRLNRAIKLFNEAAELHRLRNENHIRVEPLCYLSELYLKKRNLPAAEDCAEEIVHIISSGDGHLILDPVAAHFAVYRVFDATGDLRASDYLRMARTFLDTRSEGITDRVLRRAYRENHAIHRSIIELTADI